MFRRAQSKRLAVNLSQTSEVTERLVIASEAFGSLFSLGATQPVALRLFPVNNETDSLP